MNGRLTCFVEQFPTNLLSMTTDGGQKIRSKLLGHVTQQNQNTRPTAAIEFKLDKIIIVVGKVCDTPRSVAQLDRYEVKTAADR